MNAQTGNEAEAAVIQTAWEMVLPIPEIIKHGREKGFKLSHSGRELSLTLVAVELARENANCQIVVEQNSDLLGYVNTMVCGTVAKAATQVKLPEPPILIFLFDCSGVRVLRFELDKTPAGKNRLWLFEDSVWKEVWVQP